MSDHEPNDTHRRIGILEQQVAVLMNELASRKHITPIPAIPYPYPLWQPPVVIQAAPRCQRCGEDQPCGKVHLTC